MFGSVTVVDAASAVAALETIIEQGEGTSASPVEVDGPNGNNDFAHFYRLSELKHGRRLVQVPDAESRLAAYAFAGDAVTVDPRGVYDLPTDSASSDHPDGSLATMSTLENLARAMARGSEPSGVPIGPSFEYCRAPGLA